VGSYQMFRFKPVYTPRDGRSVLWLIFGVSLVCSAPHFSGVGLPGSASTWRWFLPLFSAITALNPQSRCLSSGLLGQSPLTTGPTALRYFFFFTPSRRFASQGVPWWRCPPPGPHFPTLPMSLFFCQSHGVLPK